jgi:glycosyltransferase involved in cell wall biosynthesis
MISVMQFTNTMARGGVEEHILSLLWGLDRRHFRFSMVCPSQVAEKIRPDVPAWVELHSLELVKVTQTGAALELARLIRNQRVDILHAHMFQSSMFASPIGKLCRVPVTVETPHIREHWRSGWLKGNFVVDRTIGRMVDHYIAVSEANARYLIESKGLPASKITVIHPGSDLRRFADVGAVRGDLKARLGFAESDPVLLVVGRLESQKGHRVLLEAMPEILRKFPATRLVCLSEGSLRPELEQRTRHLGLDAAVHFVGYQPDVVEWLSLADVSVLPSFFEGLPLTAIESMAAGRPIVASAVDGTPEAVLDGQTGFTVPPGDPASLADAICKLLADRGLRERMSRAGRQWVLENFSKERLMQRTGDFYIRAWEQHLSKTERSPLAVTGTAVLDGIRVKK